MPLDALTDEFIHIGIVGQVYSVTDRGGNLFDVRIALATATVGIDAGQLLNMALGNTSLHPDVTLIGLDAPPGLPAPATASPACALAPTPATAPWPAPPSSPGPAA